MTDNLLKPQDAAKQLGVSPRTLRRWKSKGLINPVPTGSGKPAYNPNDVLKLKDQKFQPLPPTQSSTPSNNPLLPPLPKSKTIPEKQVNIPAPPQTSEQHSIITNNPIIKSPPPLSAPKPKITMPVSTPVLPSTPLQPEIKKETIAPFSSPQPIPNSEEAPPPPPPDVKKEEKVKAEEKQPEKILTKPPKKPGSSPNPWAYSAIFAVLLLLGGGGIILANKLNNQNTDSRSQASFDQSPQNSNLPQPSTDNLDSDSFLNGKITIGTDTGELSNLDQFGNLNVSGNVNIGGKLHLTPQTPPSSPVAGDQYFNSTTKSMYYYNGTDWVDLSTSTSSVSLQKAYESGKTIETTKGDLSFILTENSNGDGDFLIQLQGNNSEFAVQGGADQELLTLNDDALYPVDISQATRIAANLFANKLTDTGNSSYYIDPASTTTAATLAGGISIGGGITFSQNNEILTNGTDGYITSSAGFSIGGDSTYYFDTDGDINASAITAEGKLDANGQIDLGDGGDSIDISGNSINIKSGNNIDVRPNNDGDDYLYFTTSSNNPTIHFEGISTTNDPGLRTNSSTGQVEYRDEDSATWITLDSLGGSASIFTDGSGITYLTDTAEDFAVGGTSSAANFYVDAGTGNANIAGTIDLGTNTITDGTLSGNWAFGSGNLSGIGSLSSTSVTATGAVTGGSLTDGTATLSSGNLSGIGTTQLNTVTYTWPASDGTSSYVLSTNGSGTLSWAAPGGTGYWTQASGVVHPTTTTDDLAVGGTDSAAPFFVDAATGNMSVTGTTDLGTNTIYDGNLTGNWAFNSGTLTGINSLTATTITDGTASITTGVGSGFTSLSASGAVTGGSLTDGTATLNSGAISGATNITMSGTLDLGTNTIADGAFTGDWDFGTGALSGISTLTATGTITGGSLTDGTASLSSGNLSGVGTTQLNGVTYTWPGADGSTDYVLTTNGSGTLSWTAQSGGSNLWSLDSGAIHPINNTVDFLVGSDASSSAAFAVLNVDSGIPTASVSAGASGGSYLTAGGNLQTTALQNLVIGGSTTGGVTIDENLVVTGTSSLGGNTDVTGNITATGALDVEGTLTSGTGNAFNVDASGNIDAGTWTADVVGEAYGGTGQSSYAVGDLLYADGAASLARLADVAVGNVLLSGGVGVAPSWGQVTLGTHTTGDYVSTITGTANQISADVSTGDVTLSIPSDFRAPGTVNAVNGIYTGATAGTERIDASGNLTNIGTTELNGVTYTWPGSDGTTDQVLATNGGGTLSWASVLTDSPQVGAWSHSDHFLYPDEYWVDDLVIGGNSTASAKFQIIGESGNIATNNNTVDWDLTSAVDALNIGSDTLSIDASNWRVGIGTASPQSELDVNGAIQANGNIQNDYLVLNSNAISEYATNANSTIYISYTGYNQDTDHFRDLWVGDGKNNEIFFIDGSDSEVNITGTLGVGDTTPDAFLDITGTTEQLRLSYETGDTNFASFTLSSGGDLTIDATGNDLTLSDNVSFGGTTTLNTITYTWPGADGSSGYALTTNGSGTLSWADQATLGTNYWLLQNGAIFPENNTLDFLVGSSASSSAKFAVLNVDSGTPTASVSAGVAGATYLTADGTLATTAMQNLSIGDSSTANILFNQNGNVGIGTANPTGKLYINNGNSLIQSGYYGVGVGVGNESRYRFGNGYIGSFANVNFSLQTDGNNKIVLGAGVNGDINFYNGTGDAIFNGSGNVGISDATPDHKLDIEGGYEGNALVSLNETLGNDIFTASASGTTRFVIANDGDVGIGTDSPQAKLHVYSGGETLRVDGSSTYPRFNFMSGDAGVAAVINFNSTSGNTKTIYFGEAADSGDYIFRGSGDFQIAAGNLDANGSSNDIAGTLNLSGNTLTSSSDLTINPASASDIYFHGPSYQISDTGDVSLGGRLTFENSEYISNETDSEIIFNDTASFLNIDLDEDTGTAVDLTTSGGDDLTLNPSGLVGIGTTTPDTAKLHVVAGSETLRLDGGAGNYPRLNFMSNDGGVAAIINFNSTSGNTKTVYFGETADSGDYYFRGTGTYYFEAGSLGIADTSPDAKLDITGTTEQLRLSYETGDTNYASFTLSSGGDLTIDATGNDLTLSDNVSFGGTTTLNTVTYTWPGADGSNGYALTTNGSGTLSWQDQATLGTNYWDHTDHSLFSKEYWADDLIIGGNSTASAAFQVLAGSGNVKSDGSMAIGAASLNDNRLFNSAKSDFDVNSTVYGQYNLVQNTNAGASANATGIYSEAYIDSGSATAIAGDFYAQSLTLSSETVKGVNVEAYDAATLYGGHFKSYASGNTDTTYGVYSVADGSSKANSKSYGAYIQALDTSGTNSETYGAYIDTTVDWGIGYGLYVDAGTGTGTEYAASFINGNVGINDTTPDHLLDIEGGYEGNALVSLNETLGNDIFTASASGTTRFVIANDGDVGIGTASPNNALEILSTTTPQMRIAYDSNNYATFGVSGSGGFTLQTLSSSGSNEDIELRTPNFDNALYVDESTQGIGINTATPTDGNLLHLASTTSEDYNKVIFIDHDNDAKESSSALHIDNDLNWGTGTDDESAFLANIELDFNPTITVTSSEDLEAIVYGIDNRIGLGNFDLDGTGGGSHIPQAYGIYNWLSENITLDNSYNGSLALAGTYNRVNNIGIPTSVGSAAITSYGGYFENSFSTIGDANLTSNAYGVRGGATGNLSTTGTTTHYGGYFTASGTADTNYGVYTTASGATTNYGIYSAAGDNYFAGDVGIGTSSPGSLLELVATSPTLTIEKDSGGTGTLLFENTGGLDYAQIYLSTNEDLYIGTTTEGANYVQFQTDGLDRMRIAETGEVGIGETTPDAKLDVDGGYAGNALVIFNETNGNDIFAASASGVTRFRIGTDGYTHAARFVDSANSTYYIDPAATGTSVNIDGDITSNGAFTIDSNGNNSITIDSGSATTKIGSSGAGKLDAGTIDPPYTINGEKYATYLSGMIGVKEEVSSTVNTDSYIPGIGYRHTINFKTQPKASDLWLFSETTDLRKNIDRLAVLLSPAGNTRAWYELDTRDYLLHIYTTTPTQVSYRLTAPRFDAEEWTNNRDSDSTGFILDNNGDWETNQDGSVIGSSNLGEVTINQTDVLTYNLQNLAGDIVENLGFFSDLIVANLKAGLIEVRDLVASTSIRSPLVESDQVATNLISPLGSSKNITIDLVDEETQEAGTLEVLGDIDVTGDIEAENATFSGTLVADNIQSQNINSLQTTSASQSSRLAYLENVSQQQQGELDQLKEISTSPTPTPDTSALPEPTPENQTEQDKVLNDLITQYASISAIIAAGDFDYQSTSQDIDPLYLQGLSLNTLSINDSAIVGENLIITNQSLQTLDDTLFLQPTGGSVNLAASTLIVRDDGTVDINGNLNVSGTISAKQVQVEDDIKVKGAITTNTIKSEFGELLDIKLATESALAIYQDLNSSPSASITASGSATFNKLALPHSSGSDIIATDNQNKIVSVKEINKDSQVFVTFSSDYSPATKYWVTTDWRENTFTVHLNYPVAQDVKINWMIIN
ncbi:MerR family DNA-binding transcriptional regulator [Patescibacteria group bacterium]